MSATQQTIAGTGALDRSLSQFFTPADLALKVWRWALAVERPTGSPIRVLEPSAGRGALVAPMLDGDRTVRVTAYELDDFNAASMVEKWESKIECGALRVCHDDFLAAHKTAVLGPFDIAILNPPFEDDGDIDFARACCEVATHAVGIFPARMLHSVGRAEFWRWHDIRREAVLSKRPRFGGPMQGMTDFLVLDIARRERARLQGEATATQTEWW